MTDRFASLLRHKGFGSILFDSRLTIVRMDPQADALLGLPTAAKPGGSLPEAGAASAPDGEAQGSARGTTRVH